MQSIEILFWLFALVVFYTYIGYGVLLYFAVRIKRWLAPSQPLFGNEEWPEVSLLIPAYNERDFVDAKVANTQQLDYPAEKLHQIWVTDGSDDGTPDLLAAYQGVRVLHEPARQGKIMAMNRAMRLVDTPLVIFTDANTQLGRQSVRRIAEQFRDPRVGCVSGEKRVRSGAANAAASAGEGLYWRYESTLKKWDAELNTAVGAAGELFAIRRELFREVEPDTLLDDFMISLRMAMQGYKIAYDPEAYAEESSSANVREELKRKVRIAAGGLQSVVRLWPLLNVFRYGLTSWQYISHRVLRWTLAPLSVLGLLLTNLLLAPTSYFFAMILLLQTLFYVAALGGWFLQDVKLRIKGAFVPYYFLVMNVAVFQGFWRLVRNKQSVNWERAKRAMQQV